MEYKILSKQPDFSAGQNEDGHDELKFNTDYDPDTEEGKAGIVVVNKFKVAKNVQHPGLIIRHTKTISGKCIGGYVLALPMDAAKELVGWLAEKVF